MSPARRRARYFPAPQNRQPLDGPYGPPGAFACSFESIFPSIGILIPDRGFLMRVWIGRFRKVKCRATLSGTRMGKARPGPRHNGRPLGGSGRRQCNPFSPLPSRPDPGPRRRSGPAVKKSLRPLQCGRRLGESANSTAWILCAPSTARICLAPVKCS